MLYKLMPRKLLTFSIPQRYINTCLIKYGLQVMSDDYILEELIDELRDTSANVSDNKE